MGVELPASARCCAFSATSSETNVGDRKPEPDEPTFDVTTTPDSKQQRAYDLLKGITV